MDKIINMYTLGLPDSIELLGFKIITDPYNDQTKYVRVKHFYFRIN